MRRRTSQTLFDYWNEVRGDRLAPRRFDIEPARISSILAETFILERLDPHTFRFRLAGTRICEIFGQELRNTSFLQLFPADDRLHLGRQLGTIAEQGGVCVVEFRASAGDRKSVLFECMILPLTDPRGVVTRYLGAISPSENPEWLGTEAVSIRSLVRDELIWPDGRPHPVVERSGFQAPFRPHLVAARIVKSKNRQFRVFEGGRSAADLDEG
jgi:hypothetical protein